MTISSAAQRQGGGFVTLVATAARLTGQLQSACFVVMVLDGNGPKARYDGERGHGHGVASTPIEQQYGDHATPSFNKIGGTFRVFARTTYIREN